MDCITVEMERQVKWNVSWIRLRRQAKVIAEEMGISDNTGSDKWIQGFIKRDKLVLRMATHVPQQDKRTVVYVQPVQIAKLYGANVSLASKCISTNQAQRPLHYSAL